MSRPSDAPPDAPPATLVPPRATASPRGALLVALLTALPLLPTLRAAFVYDDTTIIRDNGWLRGWPALAHVWAQPYWPTTGPDALGLYRPLHVALLATIWNATHGTALAFHLYALALAIVASLAVWWLLRGATSAVAALAGAAWFATHPLHVEAVASVANSSEMLVVLATIGLVRLLATGAGGPASWRRSAGVALLGAAALLAKESGLFALPLALLTVWGWHRPSPTGEAGAGPRPGWRGLLRANGCALALGAAALGASLVARHAVLGAAIARTSIAAQGLDGAPPARVGMMLSLWPRIAAMLAWPSSLAPYYGPTLVPTHAAMWAAASAGVALLVLALAVHAARRGDRRPAVAVGWIVLTYLPAANLLVATGQILSDRTLFGATVGVALAVAWALDPLAAHSPRTRRLALLVLGLVIAHGAFVTVRYAMVWTTHRSLWTDLVRVEPREHLGYKLLGMDARARGERARAVALLGRAHAMAPTDRQIRFEYGQALYEAARFGEAAAVLGALLDDDDVQREPAAVGLYLDAVGRARGAAAVVDAAAPLVRTPAAATAALYIGLAYQRLGRPANADSAWRAGLAATPGDSALAAQLAPARRRRP